MSGFVDNQTKKIWQDIDVKHSELFFSSLYEDRKDIFEGLKIWKYEKYRKLQGTFPVIYMTFAAVKASDFDGALHTISRYFYDLYVTHDYIKNAYVLSDEDKSIYEKLLGTNG